MKRSSILLLAALAIFALAAPVSAYPTFFDQRCASCHSNDTATCNGCHHHGPSGLSAAADASSYSPGAPVTVTLSGGSQHGWVRGILYDENDVVMALASGPTGTGDDSQGGAVTLPVQLSAAAPITAGAHAWQAAWFGAENAGGGAHSEVRRSVTINVEATPVDDTNWSNIRSLY